MSASPEYLTFSAYIDHVNTPLTFFTVHGDLTPYSMFMAYFHYAWLWSPASSPTLFSDLIVECLVMHTYFLAHEAQFLKQKNNGWPTHSVPYVRDNAAKLSKDSSLRADIDKLVSEWVKQCDETLYRNVYTSRNTRVLTYNYALRAASFCLLIVLGLFINYAITMLTTAYIVTSILVGFLLCDALAHAFKPLPLAADLSCAEKYDQTEEIFDLKQSAIHSFCQAETSMELNQAFAENVLSRSFLKTSPEQHLRDSTKQVILFLAQDLLKQRYEQKYSDYDAYCNGDKAQKISPDEGAAYYDLRKYSPC